MYVRLEAVKEELISVENVTDTSEDCHHGNAHICVEGWWDGDVVIERVVRYPRRRY